jgi:Adenylate and Guanylate cyclase catalytic domain
MNDRINKTSICSIVFLDIIDYSEKSVSQQIEVKNQFNSLINQSLNGVAKNERIILDTGDGAAIAHIDSPEDALFVSLSIRDEILKSNIHSAMPLYVRFGINLGPVRVVTDINGQPNIIGDGINVAQRIMSFAKPNQILASRSYFEVTSRLTEEISQMFEYVGIKNDKHAREHEIYSVHMHDDSGAIETLAAFDRNAAAQSPSFLERINWKIALPAVMAGAALVALAQIIANPTEPNVVISQPAENTTVLATAGQAKAIPDAIDPAATPPVMINEADQKGLMPNETVETLPEISALNKGKILTIDNQLDINATPKTEEELLAMEKEKLAKKKAKQKLEALPPEFSQASVEANKKPTATENTVDHNKQTEQATIKQPEKTAEVKTEKVKDKTEKSGWDAFKDSVKTGESGNCSQAQIAMNQCR